MLYLAVPMENFLYHLLHLQENHDVATTSHSFVENQSTVVDSIELQGEKELSEFCRRLIKRFIIETG